MRITMFSVSAITVFLVFAVVASAFELPEKSVEALERAKDDFNSEYAAATDALVKAVDSAIKDHRKSKKLKPDERVEIIEMLEAEKIRFEKHGRIPLSQPMRGATVNYLKRLQKA